MYCKLCRKPVYFAEKAYVKIVTDIGEAFYHLMCFETAVGVRVHQYNRQEEMTFPCTSMGEPI